MAKGGISIESKEKVEKCICSLNMVEVEYSDQIVSGGADIPVSKLPEHAHALGTYIYYLLGMTDHCDWTDDQLLLLAESSSSNASDNET